MDDAVAKYSESLQDLILRDGLLKSLGLLPEDLQIGLTLARNQIRRGAYRDALRTYSFLVLLRPLEVDHQLGLANCAVHVGEYSLALQAASAAVAIAPKNPRGYFFSAKACLSLGHLVEAEEDLRDALRLARDARDTQIFQEATRMQDKIRRAKS